MAQVNRDRDDLAQIVTPIINAFPQLWRVIEQRDATIAVLVARVAVLEAEKARLEEARALAEGEAERWYHESLRLEAKLP